MRWLPLTIAIAGAAATQPAPSWTEAAVSQADMNAGAGGDLDTARKELDAAYQAAMHATSDDAAQKARLAASQKAFDAYVEAQMDALYGCDDSSYGSVKPMCAAMQRAALLEQRTATLRAMLPSEEGDVCAWRPTCGP